MPNFSKIDLYFLLFNFYDSVYNLNKFSFFKSNLADRIVQNNRKNVIEFLNSNFPKAKTNFPILGNIKKFHEVFLKNILEQFKICNYNLNFCYFQNCLRSIMENKVVVTNADKNLGVVLVEEHIYNELCLVHLKDTSTYKQIYFNPHFLLYDTCKKALINLNINNHISNSLFKTLLNNVINKKLPNLSILLKLHKIPKLGIRHLKKLF